MALPHHAPADTVLGCRELAEQVASHLTANEAACALRPLNKATAAVLSGPQFTTIRLSEPSPHYAYVQQWCSPGRGLRGLSLRQRTQLLCLTAASGSIPNLEAALERTSCPLSEQLMRAAASAGKLHVCEWLRARGCPWGAGVATAAARAGHLLVCRWLHERGCPFSEQALLAAAAGGHRPVCQFLMWTGLRSAGAALRAAEGGHVDLMDWLLGIRPVPSPDDLLASVAAGCDLSTLQRMFPDGFNRHSLFYAMALWNPLPAPLGDDPMDQDVGDGAGWPAAVFPGAHHHAQDGQAAPPPPLLHPGLGNAIALAQAHANQAPNRVSVVRAAAGSPTPDWRDKVLWLLSRGHARDPAAFEAAAAAPDGAGRIAWLREQGFQLSEPSRALESAAHGGNTTAVQHLLGECGAQPTHRAASVAAKAGHLEALQALHAAAATAASAAAAADASAVATTAASAAAAAATPASAADAARIAAEATAAGDNPAAPLGPAVSPLQPHQLLEDAARGGHLHVMTWLAEQALDGPGLEAASVGLTVIAAARGDAAMLRWLAGRGCLALARVDAWAVAVGAGASIDFLERLDGLGCRPMGADGSLYTLAACNGDLDTLQFLRHRAYPWDQSGSAFAAAVSGGAALPALRWLLGAGCPLDWGRVMEAAGKRGADCEETMAALAAEEQDKAAGAQPQSSITSVQGA